MHFIKAIEDLFPCLHKLIKIQGELGEFSKVLQMMQRNLRKSRHLLDCIFRTLQISVAFKNFGLFTCYKNKLRSEEITVCTTGIVPFFQKQTCLTGFTGTLIVSPYTISFSLKYQVPSSPAKQMGFA